MLIWYSVRISGEGRRSKEKKKEERDREIKEDMNSIPESTF